MSIRIMTDSASDITLEQLKENDVKLISMPIMCEEKSYIDDKTVPTENFWKIMEDGVVVKTSQPSPEVFLKAFEEAKKDGDSVVCILISSKLSGTFQGALMAKEMVDYDEIYIVDALSAAASVAEKMLVYRACQLRDEGKLTAREVAEDLIGFRSRVRLFACLDTLEYLARGGRLNRYVATIGTAMGIKPIITFNSNGSIDVAKKARGADRAMREMISEVMSRNISKDYPITPIYARNPDNCLSYVDKLKEAGLLLEISEAEGIGVTIGSYIGPGAYGIVFVEEEANA